MLNKLEWTDCFLIINILSQIGAAFFQYAKHRWLEGTLWFCYATATVMILLLSLKARS